MTLRPIKSPRPQPLTRCALCDRALSRPGFTVPALGMVGPECERRVGDLLAHLQGNGLGELILTGTVRFPCLAASNGLYTYPLEALDLSNAAKRCGLLLDGTLEAGVPPVWVARLNPASVQACMRRQAVMA